MAMDNIIFKKNKSIGVRLEDLKKFPKKTISQLCKWMGIQDNESLYKMTMQGEKWWETQPVKITHRMLWVHLIKRL